MAIRHDSLQKIDAVTLKHLAAELHRMLHGARVSRIVHPNAKEFVITFWGHAAEGADVPLLPRGELNQFYINLHPELCYVLLLAPGEKDQLIRSTLHHPTSICMLLRKHLGNAKVLDVWCLPHERVLNIRFENFNELGNKVLLVLTLELMGKHSNMMLYDEMEQEILAISHSVSEQMSRYRELTVGLPYVPPPRDPKKRPFEQLTQAEFSALLAPFFEQLKEIPIDNLAESLGLFLSERLEGVGHRMLAAAIGENLKEQTKTDTGEISKFLYAFLQSLISDAPMPSINEGNASFTLTAIRQGQSYASVHEMLRAYLLPKTSQRRVQDWQRQLLQVVDSQEKRRLKREQTLTPIAEADIEELQQAGHLLMAEMSSGQLPPRPTASVVHIANMYGDGEPMPLEVDPSIGWRENAEQYYRRAKKAKARQGQFEMQAETLEQERQFLAELRLMVEQADSLKTLQGIEEDLVTAGLMKSSTIMLGKQKKQSSNISGVLTLGDTIGVQYLVGRTNFANGDLVGHLGKPNDWWFHVHQMPGSHVLVKLPPDDASQQLSNEIILKASNLAVYFSSGRESKNVPVVYTQIKHVRKIPGSYPGHVTYKQESSVFITSDSEVISPLLEPVKRAMASE